MISTKTRSMSPSSPQSKRASYTKRQRGQTASSAVVVAVSPPPPPSWNWKTASDKMYESLADIRKYQRAVLQCPRAEREEQEWVDRYLQPIIDVMGSQEVWNKYLSSRNIPEIILFGLKGGRASRNQPLSSTHPQAKFSGGHWNSRKAGETSWFDPYKAGFQIAGTNQLCQTYSLMYICDALPAVAVSEEDQSSLKSSSSSSIAQYYTYTLHALEFIRVVLVSTKVASSKVVREEEQRQKLDRTEGAKGEKCRSSRPFPSVTYLVCIKECLRHFRRCLNVIAIDSSVVLPSFSQMKKQWKIHHLS